MTTGEKIKQYRKRNGITQEKLAELLQVSNNTISRWENGIQEPRAKVISEMAKLLGTTTLYLLGDTDNPLGEDEKTSNQTLISRTHESSNKEQSINSGMLVYETRDGYRFEAPPTEIGIKYLEKMRMATMGLPTTAGAMA